MSVVPLSQPAVEISIIQSQLFLSLRFPATEYFIHELIDSIIVVRENAVYAREAR